MTVVHFYAGTQSHFVNHLAPIWAAMPEENRGSFLVRNGLEAQRRAAEVGIPWKRFTGQFRSSELVVVAGYEDYRVARLTRVIFVNHGVGQTYFGDKRSAGMSSYSGGRGRERTVLYLCPSERDALTNRTFYPDTPAVAVGVPYLDHIQPTQDGPVVVSFHANIHACPETRWAWPHFKQAVVDLSREIDLVGHCHPRARRELEPWFKRYHIPFEPDLWKVLSMASCYVIDNSSSGYEAAALGIPTVWMNAPWYRRDINHGLRFWSDIPGVEVDDPDDLAAAIKLAVQNPPELVQKRESAVRTAYSGLCDGHATERAVEAICQLIHGSPTQPRLSSTTSGPS